MLRPDSLRLIDLGRVVSVHGLEGEVVVQTLGDAPEGLRRYPGFHWFRAEAGERRLEVETCRSHRGMALLRFRGVTGRDQAAELVGGTLRLPREELKPAGEGRHYVADLVGMRVETTDGRTVGLLREVMETGANDVYAIDADGREVLVPAVDHIVREIDVDGRRMVIEAMDGLLD